MRHVTLIAREDENSGEIGLIIKGMQNFDVINPSLEGRLLAHDLFEHVNGIENIGSGAGDELIALGAVWYVRGQWGDLNRPNNSFYSPEQSIAADVSTCMRRWFYDGKHFNMPVPKARHEMNDTLPYMFRHVDPLDEGLGMMPGDLSEFLLSARHFMNHGYHLAHRRYRAIGTANRQFWCVADALDEQLFGKHSELYAGQQFTLSYSRNDARIREIDDTYY